MPQSTIFANERLWKAIRLWLLQVFGLVASVVFGLFSILAWQDSQVAKRQADAANMLSMVALCAQINPNSDPLYGTLCVAVRSAARNNVAQMATSVFGTLPRVVATSKSTSTTSTTTTRPTQPSSSVLASLSPTLSVKPSASSSAPGAQPPPTGQPSSVPHGAAPTNNTNLAIALGLTFGIGVPLAIVTMAMIVAYKAAARREQVRKLKEKEATRPQNPIQTGYPNQAQSSGYSSPHYALITPNAASSPSTPAAYGVLDAGHPGRAW